MTDTTKKNSHSEPNEVTKTAENAPPKTPWYLRFAGALDWKQIAATASIGAFYGLDHC